jgi:phospholipase/carboxylesterase
MTMEGDIAYDTAGALAAKDQLAQVVPAAVSQAGGDRTIVLGFSQGAMLGHGLLLKSDVKLAGLAACSGRLVPEVFDAHPLNVPAEYPVFLSHGTHDDVIPVASGHAIRDAYAKHSSAAITWVEEPVGHGIGPACLDGLRAWFGGFDRL